MSYLYNYNEKISTFDIRTYCGCLFAKLSAGRLQLYCNIHLLQDNRPTSTAQLDHQRNFVAKLSMARCRLSKISLSNSRWALNRLNMLPRPNNKRKLYERYKVSS